MSDTSKNAPFQATFTPAYFNAPDNKLLEQWFQSFDTGLQSFRCFFDFSNHFVKRVMKEQDKILGMHFNTETDKSISDTKEQSKIKVEKKVKTGVAVVTGGIGGLGTEICKRLANDNNHIIATYIAFEKEQAKNWQKERKKEGITIDIHECDVTDFDICKKFATTIEKKYGQIDVLVNCAGITRDALLRKMEEENWHAVLDTNLDSVFNVTRNFIDGMLKKGYGRIINISSVNGQRGQFGQTNYSAAKAGMIGFTRSLALELADKGITVNCICPGYVHTSMVEKIKPEILENITEQIPIKRLAKPAEIANAVAFLASKDSAYITGTELAVNGGIWLG